MARPLSVSASLVRMRAEEIRSAGVFRGQNVHFGTRPPRGSIAFTAAVAKRLGCSVTLVKRVLSGRSRSGPRRNVTLRARETVNELTAHAVRDAINALITMTTADGGPAAVAALSVFMNDHLPMQERLAPLLRHVTTGPKLAPAPSQIRTAESHLWRVAPATQAAIQQSKRQSPAVIVFEALTDALGACLHTPNTLSEDARSLALDLDRQLRDDEAGRNGQSRHTG